MPFKISAPLESGISIRREFSVDVKAKYLVGVGYPSSFQFSLEVPVPDDFTATGDISLNNSAVTRAFPSYTRPAVLSRGYIVRYFYMFDGDARNVYALSLRIDNVSSSVAGKKAEVVIEVDPHFDENYSLRKRFNADVGIGLALVWFLEIINFMRSKAEDRMLEKLVPS